MAGMKRLLIVLVLLFQSVLQVYAQPQQQANPSKLPNIVFILADDLGYGDIGVYGQQLIKTPNIDQLAAEGVKFTQFYAGSTVCAPSRSSLMTGLHTGHTRVRGNASVALADNDSTLAQWLQQAGYTTGMIGKWGLGESGSSGAPGKKGFDYFYGYLNQTRAHNYYPEYLDDNEGQDRLENKVTPVQENKGKGVGGIAIERKNYSPDKLLEKTISFLDKYKDSSFFLYLSYTLPHANNEAKFFNQSGMEVPDLGIYANKDWPYDQKAHAAMISYLDTQVGTIMAKLKALGLDENTLVIFTSDNGPHNEGGANSEFFNSNGPLSGAKRDMNEGGIRVPFIARWPGVIQPKTSSDHVAAFWDIVPTFCDIAQKPSPAGLDGISFAPTLLRKGQQAKHKYLYWEFYEQGGKQAIRFNNWKCIKLNVDSAGKEQVLLFDLAKDLEEQRNVAAANPGIVDKAVQWMKEAHGYSDDFHFKGEHKAD
jgi:arylsulfatase A